ncbi:hypothetical protein [Halobacillus seohaensis]|uniref:Citrate transporter-like domain-containing protein n=1 Tax=Halobacillus seohaensis TaxID=447421 RepID=A0ABW2EI91_9BACI
MSITIDLQDQVPKQMLFRKIGLLFSMLFILILIAFFVEKWLALSYFNAVIITIPFFTLIWSVAIKQFKSFISYNAKVWVTQVNGLQNLMLLFLSLGFFSMMFENTSIIQTLQEPLLLLTSVPLVIFIAIQVISLTFSLIGIHPLVTISLMGTLIQPLLTELNPLSLAIVLLTSTLASDAAGTFNTTISIMSQITKRNPYRVTLWNLLFAIWFGLAGSLLGWLLL